MKIRSLVLAAGVAASLAHAALALSPAEMAPVVQRVQSDNGTWFTITKSFDAQGTAGVTYTSPEGVSMTAQEFHAFNAQNPPSKVDPALRDAVARVHPGQMLPVAIWLAYSPFEAIKDEVQAAHRGELDAIEARRQAYYAMSYAPEFDNAQARDSWFAGVAVLGDPTQDPMNDLRRAIADDYEALKGVMREEISARLLPAIAPSQLDLENKVKALGGEVRSTLDIINGASVYLPAAAVAQLANDPAIANLVYNAPGQGELDDQKTSLGLTTGFWANGVDGGAFDAGQLDSGIQENHPSFSGVTFLNGPGMGTTDSDGHGTAVASIMSSGDATFRGIAFGTTKHLNSSWNDVQASVNWMHLTASDDPEVINGSFGIPADAPSVADYTATETYIDYMVRTQNALYCKSCGNLGPAANTLTQPAGIFNGIATANVYDFNNTSRTDDTITNSSSRGPTLGGRKKPDLSAPGTNTAAANNGWSGAGADWINFGGTSSASPHTAGGALLLTDARINDDELSLKAILINTADSWTDGGTLASTTDDGPSRSPGWNATYGWGYLDLGSAYTNRFNVINSTIPATPAYRLYKGSITTDEKVTLTWNRFVSAITIPPFGTIYAAQTLTDLDLRLYRASDNFFDDVSTSNIDNVEQVSADSSYTAVLKVETIGSVDPDIGVAEPFALAHPGGFTAVSMPALTSSANPGAVSPGEPFTLHVFVSNNSADLPAHNVSLNMLAAPPGWTISPTGVVNIGTLQDHGETRVLEFTVTPPCNIIGTTGTFNWSVTHASYGESITYNDSDTVTVEPIAALVVNTPTAVTTPRTFSLNITSADWYVAAGSEVFSRNINVRGDNDACITSPWNTSDFSNVPDFIVINGHNNSGDQYAHIYEAAGNNTVTSIEFDDAFDVVLASTLAMEFTSNEPIEPAERSLNSGKLYRIEAVVTAGAINPGLFIYTPSQTLVERNSASVVVNNAQSGIGAAERINFRPALTGIHAFIVTNENQSSGTVNFEVRCAADYNSSGSITVQDIFDFLDGWFSLADAADFNISGSVTVQDIFDFLDAWFQGC